MFNVTFNGRKKEYITVLRKFRPPWAPIRRRLLTLGGMPGALLESTETEPRPISAEVLIESDLFSSLEKAKEDLTEWLFTKEAAELVFDDEPDRIYYAVIDGTLNLEEIVKVGKGIITFICPDPYKYGPERTAEFVEGVATFENVGSAPSYPVITAEVTQPITFLNVLSDEYYNQIGEPAEAGVTPIEKQTRMLWTEANGFVGWTDSTTVTDGVVSGLMKTDGFYFYTDDYGSNTGWHGPAKKTSLSQSLQDFALDVVLQQRAIDPKQIGRVMVEMLDENNKVVARLQMWRRSQYANGNYALFTIHNGTEQEIIYHDNGGYPWIWDDFYGMLSIRRDGTTWGIYVGQIDRGTLKHHSRLGMTFNDVQGKYLSTVRQVLFHVGAYGTMPATSQRIDDIKVYKINNTDTGIPTIANAGDIIELDHQKNSITINGREANDLKNFGASFFALNKGVNQVSIYPSDSLRAELKYRERYL